MRVQTNKKTNKRTTTEKKKIHHFDDIEQSSFQILQHPHFEKIRVQVHCNTQSYLETLCRQYGDRFNISWDFKLH